MQANRSRREDERAKRRQPGPVKANRSVKSDRSVKAEEIDISSSDISPSDIVSINPAAAASLSVSSLPLYLTFEQVFRYVVPVPVKTLRWWRLNNTDDFDRQCCTKRGGRVFVIKTELVKWMERGR